MWRSIFWSVVAIVLGIGLLIILGYYLGWTGQPNPVVQPDPQAAAPAPQPPPGAPPKYIRILEDGTATTSKGGVMEIVGLETRNLNDVQTKKEGTKHTFPGRRITIDILEDGSKVHLTAEGIFYRSVRVAVPKGTVIYTGPP
jgi:hypothetical protein